MHRLGKFATDATSNYRSSAGVVRGRVYRFKPGRYREKYPRHVGTTTSGREEWELALFGFRGIFFRVFHVDKKMWNTNFPSLLPPRAARPPATPRSMPGRAMVVVYSFFSFFKKNDVFIGYV